MRIPACLAGSSGRLLEATEAFGQRARVLQARFDCAGAGGVGARVDFDLTKIDFVFAMRSLQAMEPLIRDVDIATKSLVSRERARLLEMYDATGIGRNESPFYYRFGPTAGGARQGAKFTAKIAAEVVADLDVALPNLRALRQRTIAVRSAALIGAGSSGVAGATLGAMQMN